MDAKTRDVCGRSPCKGTWTANNSPSRQHLFRTRAGCLKSIKLQARSLFGGCQISSHRLVMKCQRALVCGLLFDTKGVELAVIRQVVQILGMNTGRFCRVNRLSCGSGCAKLQRLRWRSVLGTDRWRVLCLTKLIRKRRRATYQYMLLQRSRFSVPKVNMKGMY